MLGPWNFLEVCAASTRVCCEVTRLRLWAAGEAELARRFGLQRSPRLLVLGELAP